MRRCHAPRIITVHTLASTAGRDCTSGSGELMIHSGPEDSSSCQPATSGGTRRYVPRHGPVESLAPTSGHLETLHTSPVESSTAHPGTPEHSTVSARPAHPTAADLVRTPQTPQVYSAVRLVTGRRLIGPLFPWRTLKGCGMTQATEFSHVGPSRFLGAASRALPLHSSPDIGARSSMDKHLTTDQKVECSSHSERAPQI